MELQLICDICREVIGRFDPEKVKLPLKGEMFKPIDDIHGYPPPFNAGATWEHFHCPRDANPVAKDRHRPIVNPTVLKTDKGPWLVGSKPPGQGKTLVEVFSDEDLEAEWYDKMESLMAKTGTMAKPPKTTPKIPKSLKPKPSKR